MITTKTIKHDYLQLVLSALGIQLLLKFNQKRKEFKNSFFYAQTFNNFLTLKIWKVILKVVYLCIIIRDVSYDKRRNFRRKQTDC